ncbi:hypothetical protein BB934_43090 (plasmid) [Microvirga ossetica]|uniref:DUF2382 domain-containing protein n=1 Tax=Microvirga ossetica TaxID=1882682 RepID=A0A1B2EYH5_9HYPH|nr:DUF2382 domain-containing protein [Microvirga ossetica]ANY85006.1 hypothetical protein BB934_43090 [Microvirga ossetica]
MADPAHASSAPPDDDEPVPGLDDASRSGVCTVSEEVIPLVEETATVSTRQAVTGRVRVRITDTIEELAHAEVLQETVEVTRVPVDKVVEIAPEIRTEGDVTIVPVLEEELHIRRRVKSEAVEVPVTLRKQRAIVERLVPDAPEPDGHTTS